MFTCNGENECVFSQDKNLKKVIFQIYKCEIKSTKLQRNGDKVIDIFYLEVNDKIDQFYFIDNYVDYINFKSCCVKKIVEFFKVFFNKKKCKFMFI